MTREVLMPKCNNIMNYRSPIWYGKSIDKRMWQLLDDHSFTSNYQVLWKKTVYALYFYKQPYTPTTSPKFEPLRYQPKEVHINCFLWPKLLQKGSNLILIRYKIHPFVKLRRKEYNRLCLYSSHVMQKGDLTLPNWCL